MLLLLSSKVITDACMVFIGQLTELIELRLGACNQLTNKGMVHLQSLTKLQYLGLSSNEQCTNDMLQYLRSPALTGINCCGSNIDHMTAQARIKELRQW